MSVYIDCLYGAPLESETKTMRCLFGWLWLLLAFRLLSLITLIFESQAHKQAARCACLLLLLLTLSVSVSCLFVTYDLHFLVRRRCGAPNRHVDWRSCKKK